jgi:hypothetical protein
MLFTNISFPKPVKIAKTTIVYKHLLTVWKQNLKINGDKQEIVVFIYCFMSRSRIFHLDVNVTIAVEGLQTKFKPMLSAQGLWAGGVFIVPHLLWHGVLVFPVSSEGPPYPHKGMWRTYSNPDPHGWTFQKNPSHGHVTYHNVILSYR